MKDYYATLGVSETATADEIKKVYRRLAKQYHPDATGGDVKKGDRFKEITEAYSVLSDPTKRTQYDQLRTNPYAAGAQWGGDTGVDISEIFAQFFSGGGPGGRGGARAGAGDAPHVRVHVGGMDSEGDLFGDLFGRGRTRRKGQARPEARPILLELDLREAALGTIKQAQAGGRIRKIRIPPGVQTGNRLRAEETIFEIRVREHPQLRREGTDIHNDLAVSVDEALLGAKIEVPTLDGPVTVTVPAGTSSGAALRLRGKGVSRKTGGRGDQYVHIRIVVPAQIPPRARELIEEFAHITQFRPRG